MEIKQKDKVMSISDKIAQARVVIADGVVIKNNTRMTDAAATKAEPWEIPPKGYRLVTESERKEFDARNIDGYAYVQESDHPMWKTNKGTPCCWRWDDVHYAVPEGFSFTKPEPKKMTVAQVSAMAGEEIEIIAG
jgi:hypothetical protein